jgi:hypothetical protein
VHPFSSSSANRWRPEILDQVLSLEDFPSFTRITIAGSGPAVKDFCCGTQTVVSCLFEMSRKKVSAAFGNGPVLNLFERVGSWYLLLTFSLVGG